MKLIDKDAVVAEIKKRIKETESMQPKFDQFWAGQISAFKGILKILDTLEVKEVQEEPVSNDLEREIKHYVYDPYFDLNGVAVKGATDYLTVEDVADIARHFAQWQKEQLITKACVFLKSTDFYKYYNREFVKEFVKAMEDKS